MNTQIKLHGSYIRSLSKLVLVLLERNNLHVVLAIFGKKENNRAQIFLLIDFVTKST